LSVNDQAAGAANAVPVSVSAAQAWPMAQASTSPAAQR